MLSRLTAEWVPALRLPIGCLEQVCMGPVYDYNAFRIYVGIYKYDFALFDAGCVLRHISAKKTPNISDSYYDCCTTSRPFLQPRVLPPTQLHARKRDFSNRIQLVDSVSVRNS